MSLSTTIGLEPDTPLFLHSTVVNIDNWASTIVVRSAVKARELAAHLLQAAINIEAGERADEKLRELDGKGAIVP